MLLTRALLNASGVTPARAALNLHVSCTPPALILSQDQTLRRKFHVTRPGRNRIQLQRVSTRSHARTPPCGSRPHGPLRNVVPLFNCQSSRHVTQAVTRAPWQAGKGPIIGATSDRVKTANAKDVRVYSTGSCRWPQPPAAGREYTLPMGVAWGPGPGPDQMPWDDAIDALLELPTKLVLER